MKQLSAFILSISILFSCTKEEGVYDFSTTRLLTPLLNYSIAGYPLLLELQDSLVAGDSLSFNASVVYIQGDSSSPNNPSSTLVYHVNFDSTKVQDDGRYYSGTIKINLYNQNDTYLYVIEYDSLWIKDYLLNGTVRIKEEPYNQFELLFTTPELIIQHDDEILTTELNARAYENVGVLHVLFNRRSGERVDSETTFKYESSEELEMPLDCKNFVSGSFFCRPKGYEWRELDFGDGGCDRSVKVTAGSQSLRFSFP